MTDEEKRERARLVRDLGDAHHAMREARIALKRWDDAHGFGPSDVERLLSRRDVVAHTTAEPKDLR